MPSSAWYAAHSALEKTMNIGTIKLGFWATSNEMDELWAAIQAEMDARGMLDRGAWMAEGRGKLATLQAGRWAAVGASVSRIAPFRTMMGVIGEHLGYKERLYYALRHHCVQRWGRRQKASGKRGAAASVSEETPASQPKGQLPHGFQLIHIAINGAPDTLAYLPLHLVPGDGNLRLSKLLGDETKHKLQPEDLSFGLLMDAIAEDYVVKGEVRMTCPAQSWREQSSTDTGSRRR